MSGIAGIIYPNVFQMNNLIVPMLDSMQHRKQDSVQDTHIFRHIEWGIVGERFLKTVKTASLQ